MRATDLAAFARRPWAELDRLDAAWWAERRRCGGADEAFRLADELRRFVLSTRPDWPAPSDREADLASHVALGEALRSVRAAVDR